MLYEVITLQMLYLQGMLVPNHPNNTGQRPQLIGSRRQVETQLAYLFRGNYGLASRDELLEAGVPQAQAEAIMRMKLAFAFGRIRPTEELVEPRLVEREPIELRGGVQLRRLRTNVFDVITSYSIHYTKLYDTRARPRGCRRSRASSEPTIVQDAARDCTVDLCTI